jgi:Domain of Unknown Function (DUF1080)
MPRTFALVLTAAFAASALAADQNPPAVGITIDGIAFPPPGFTALFNGHDTSGWHGWDIHEKGMSPQKFAAMSMAERTAKIAAWTADAEKHWRVEDGELINDGKGAFLTTDKDYGDIELLVEYKTVPLADSGIYLRASPQVQIWDYTETAKFKLGADKGSGGLWNNSAGAPGKDPLVLADKPFGEWNKVRVIQVGERTTVYLNDKLVVDHARMENYWEKDRKSPLFRTGPILLQTHGGEIRWRNLFVREIPSAEANEILAKHGDQGFRSLFNGHDLDGWEGPAVDEYEVKDGAIVCKPHKGGNLYTKDDFGDFVVRMEYKLPPAGNNGLLLRYPAGKKSDGAYTGMTEIQVLDDTSPQYAKLDPRQFNGSSYGMVPAHRGYMRPVGEWNFEEVTVKGSTIKVELNGTLILDCDLTKVTEFKDNHPHPGKDRTTGRLAFAGHNDPVAFRSFKVKPLE